ncbi:hypothetical protein Tco_0560844 [Tanacetum coccineum]
MSARIAEATALSPSSFRKRYRSSYETSSSSLTLLIWKRYRGTSELILDIYSEGDELGEEDNEEDESSDADDEREGQDLDDEGQDLEDEGQDLDDEGQDLDDEGQGLNDGGQGLEDEGPGMKEEEEAAPEVSSRHRALESIEEIAPSTYKVGQSSRSVPEQEGVKRISAFRQPTLITWVYLEDDRVYTDIPAYAPPTTPIQTPPSPEWLLATISIDDDQFIKVGAQLELYGSILHDHTQCLDALPPTLVADIDRDVRELYTRSGAVRDEIFSQRPVLALEAWTGQTDAQRAALWHDIYNIQRENHDLRRQLAEERRERLELTDRVARMERRQESGRE